MTELKQAVGAGHLRASGIPAVVVLTKRDSEFQQNRHRQNLCLHMAAARTKKQTAIAHPKPRSQQHVTRKFALGAAFPPTKAS